MYIKVIWKIHLKYLFIFHKWWYTVILNKYIKLMHKSPKTSKIKKQNLHFIFTQLEILVAIWHNNICTLQFNTRGSKSGDGKKNRHIIHDDKDYFIYIYVSILYNIFNCRNAQLHHI